MILILGNGISRLQKQSQIQKWQGETWVCNWAFRENLPNITRIGTVHPNVIEAANNYRKKNNFSYQIWTTQDLKGKVDGVDNYFGLKRGWSTGNMLISQAIVEGHMKIYIAGFDMGGPDIYQVNPLPGEQFKKQFDEIRTTWKEVDIIYL